MHREFGDKDRMVLPPRADLYDALIERAEELDVEIVTVLQAVAASPRGELELEPTARC